MPSTSEPTPFVVDIPQDRLDDLRRRLANVDWPHDFANDDWTYGVPADFLRGLVDEWRDGFDWRAQEAAMNAWPHFRTEIDGLPVHYLYAKGKGPNPVPLILTHGWPWTFWDFHALIGPLSDPAAYGGDPTDAFDVVVRGNLLHLFVECVCWLARETRRTQRDARHTSCPKTRRRRRARRIIIAGTSTRLRRSNLPT